MSKTRAILVADDDPIFTATAVSALGGIDCDVAVVDDGCDALMQLHERRYDLLLLDLSMPRIDGLRVMALIRSIPHLRQLPVIVVTSRRDENARTEAIRLGAKFYFAKPVRWSELKACIDATMLSVVAA